VAGRGEFGAGCWVVVDRAERQSERKKENDNPPSTLYFLFCVPRQQSLAKRAEHNSQNLRSQIRDNDARSRLHTGDRFFARTVNLELNWSRTACYMWFIVW
jgi:hypothetical protein